MPSAGPEQTGNSHDKGVLLFLQRCTVISTMLPYVVSVLSCGLGL